jgi:hypothetical protein
VDGGLAVDPLGNVIVAASTTSTDLLTLNPFQPNPGGAIDAFVLKLDPAGNKVYASYIGGAGDDPAFSVAADGAANAFVCGATTSSPFPLKSPLQGTPGGGSDLYLVKIAPGGQLVFATYLGGNGDEFCGPINTDAAGNVYLTGNTSSTNFPVLGPVQATYGGGAVDAFGVQINPAGSAIGFSTYLGGFGNDTGFGNALDAGGNFYIGMKTSSFNMPVVSPLQSTLRGSLNNYVAKMTLPGGLVAAVLPISRSVPTGGTATIFATIINTGSDTAVGCSITPVSTAPITSLYQITDPATNQLAGSPNTPASIGAGGFQTFLVAVTAQAAFGPVDLALSFGCANRASALVTTGLNTLLMSASDTPVPDIVALGATPSGDGIANIPGATGTGIFGVATVNVGAGGSITASADTGGTALPVNIVVCQTNPVTGACAAPPASSVTATINPGETPTFAAFIQGTGTVPFNPGANRVFMRFRDAHNVVRGATSAAIRTQ